MDALFQEQKIKEGLYMMGLKDGIFHLSWFITYALQVNLLLFHLLFIFLFFCLFFFCVFTFTHSCSLIGLMN